MKLAALTAVVILCVLLLCWALALALARSAVQSYHMVGDPGVRLFLGYFAIVLRGTGAENRTGDLNVYLRAAWAVRGGESPYQTTAPQGWPQSGGATRPARLLAAASAECRGCGPQRDRPEPGPSRRTASSLDDRGRH